MKQILFTAIMLVGLVSKAAVVGGFYQLTENAAGCYPTQYIKADFDKQTIFDGMREIGTQKFCDHLRVEVPEKCFGAQFFDHEIRVASVYREYAFGIFRTGKEAHFLTQYKYTADFQTVQISTYNQDQKALQSRCEYKLAQPAQ